MNLFYLIVNTYTFVYTCRHTGVDGLTRVELAGLVVIVGDPR